MDSLINIFTSEPQKLERLVILFLKFMLTCITFEIIYPSDQIFRYFSGLGIENWPPSGSFLVYTLFLIVWWFTLWNFFAEIVIRLLIVLSSRLFKPAKEFSEFLKVLNVLTFKEKGQKHINHSVLYLNEFLKIHEDHDGIDMNDFRSDIYLEIYSVATILIITSQDISLTTLQTWLWWIIGVQLFVTNAYLYRFVQFINSSYRDLLEESNRLAYVEKTRIALSKLTIINNQYSIEHKRRKIFLRYKHKAEETDDLRIIPFHSNPTTIHQEIIENEIRKMAKSNSKKGLTLFITNISICLPDSILERANCSIIKADSEFEIKQGLEVYFHFFLKQRSKELLKTLKS